MGASDLFNAGMEILLRFSPLVLLIAVISVADLFLSFLIKLFKQTPTYGAYKRRTR